jgi:hypothetical protein
MSDIQGKFIVLLVVFAVLSIVATITGCRQFGSKRVPLRLACCVAIFFCALYVLFVVTILGFSRFEKTIEMLPLIACVTFFPALLTIIFLRRD